MMARKVGCVELRARKRLKQKIYHDRHEARSTTPFGEKMDSGFEASTVERMARRDDVKGVLPKGRTCARAQRSLPKMQDKEPMKT